MPPRVLCVGNCGFDQAALARLIEDQLGAQVQAVNDRAEALRQLSTDSFDLVLVNRVFDADAGDGLELIRHLKSDPTLRSLPVMLLSNYPQYQAVAVAAGAHQGFGKAEMGSPVAPARLRAALSNANA